MAGPVTPTRAGEVECLSAGVDDKFPSTSGGLAVWKSVSIYIYTIIYVTQASSPVQFLTTRIVCGVAASEFLLTASEFIFLLAPFRDDVTYL